MWDEETGQLMEKQKEHFRVRQHYPLTSVVDSRQTKQGKDSHFV